MARKEFGGLGVGSFFAFNRAMLFKWVWRFLSTSDALWVQVLKAIHGADGGIFSANYRSHSSVWFDILKAVNSLKGKGIHLLDLCRKQVRNGMATSFWFENWLGDGPLKDKFNRVFKLDNNPHDTVGLKLAPGRWQTSLRRLPRGGAEESQWLGLCDLLSSHVVKQGSDFWCWDLDPSGCFSIASARIFIDDSVLPSVGARTRWCNLVPIKVNVFCWRLALDRLPTRVALDRRGVDVPEVFCPLCSGSPETAAHLFFSCPVVGALVRLVARWWDVPIPLLLSFSDWEPWFDGLKMGKMAKSCFEGVFFTLWWTVWSFRNQKLFGLNDQKMARLFDKVITYSFDWCNRRCKKLKINWIGWLKNPLLVLS